MKRIAVLLAVAVAVTACDRKERAAGDGKPAGEQGLVSADGVVAGVNERSVQVRTGDGRVLDLALDEDVAVTLGGGESQPAVITEGAPVRVSYKPTGSGADLVSIDVEPRSGATGQAQAPVEPPRAESRGAGDEARPAGGGR